VWSVFGQDTVIDNLATALKKGSLHHAYLFTGPEQTGKKLTAVNLAQALNCESDSAPCGECSSCRRIKDFIHADVCLLDMATLIEESGSQTGIKTEDIKDIQRFVNLPPFEGKTRVFIIDGAEKLTGHAANRLLKNLEEPPPNVVFILLSQTLESILPTVASRCQHLEFKSVPYDKLATWLFERGEVDMPKARLVSHLSGGRPGWALSALADSNFLSFYIESRNKLISLIKADRSERFKYAEKLAAGFSDDRFSVFDELKRWQTLVRDMLYMKYELESHIINCDVTQELRDMAGKFSSSGISNTLGAVGQAEYELQRNVSPRIVLESLMLKLECSCGTPIKL